MFEGRPIPILTLLSAINQLINKNSYWFNDTIYQVNLQLIYQYGSVHPVLPLRYGAIGYVLSLPVILGPDQTTLFRITSNGILNLDKIYRFKLPEYVVKLNNSFKQLDIYNCQGLGSDVRLCSNSMNVIENSCLQNQSSGDFEIRDYMKTELAITTSGYLLATKASCSENSVGSQKSKVISNLGVLFQPHNFTGALVCTDGLSVQAETRKLEVDLHYSEPFIH